MAPAHMQQEGVVAVLLPHPASRCCAPVRPCVEAPLSESTVLLAAAGACTHGAHWSSGARGPGVRVGLWPVKHATCCNGVCSGPLDHAFYLCTAQGCIQERVRGEGGGVWSPGDPKGFCKSSQRTAGGEYSDDTVVPPWLHVDASLKQSGDSGSGNNTAGPCTSCSSCELLWGIGEAGGPLFEGTPAASLTNRKEFSTSALACVFDGLSDHRTTA